jgi:hypothetical protein
MRENAKRYPAHISLALLVGLALLLAAAASAVAAAPRLSIESLSNTTAASDGEPSTFDHTYMLEVRNEGDALASDEAGQIVLSVDLPSEIGAIGAGSLGGLGFPWDCSPELTLGAHSFACRFTGGSIGTSGPDRHTALALAVSLEAEASEIETATFAVSGGGSPSASTVDPLQVSATPPPFGLDAFEVSVSADPSGQPFSAAGGHPYAVSTDFDFNTENQPGTFRGDAQPVEATRDIVTSAPPGLIGNVAGLARCTIAQLSVTAHTVPEPECPAASQVGTTLLRLNGTSLIGTGPYPVFNMIPAVGEPARFGFNVSGSMVMVDTRLRSESDYGVDFISHRIPEALGVAGANVSFWGIPSRSLHDPQRPCSGGPAPFDGGQTCPGAIDQPAFIRMPTSCTGPLPWAAHADSWVHPGSELSAGRPNLSDLAWSSLSLLSHEAPGYPFPTAAWGDPLGQSGCGTVPVKAKLRAQTTALDSETPSGLEVHLEIPNPGLLANEGISTSDLKEAKATLPEGVTLNPSQAEGLGVCSLARYESSELSFHPDGSKGCPSDSKIGTVSVKSPLLEETLPGNVYVAKPFENPFNSLLAIYIVIEEPQRGVLVKLPGEIRTNERTGRIEAEFKNLPQVPFESFDFKFREGARAPLVTPPTCGTYRTEVVFTPWSNPAQKLTSTSSFQITKGIGGGPCPSGAPGFKPSFSAGSINNNAGSYSPFKMRLTRSDGEQDMTRFSAVLPPGVLGKLTGLGKCPEAAIALAKSKSGLDERANPSCPANSQIGRSLVGAGVGSVLTYVPGKIYLGGPFHGAPLSVIAITPAVAGPFDVGTVVVREALTLNPRTAEVEVDGAASDPIPHILEGIPVKLRDLRVYVDRPEFILNPTSCDPSSTEATLFGSAQDVFSSADDVPVSLSDRFQAASCASLGFKPRLSLKLKGGTRRGAHPGLTATYRPRGGNANLNGLTVTLPRSAFLEQAHIRTICTRVQFAADACPKGSIYGRITAWTPLLDEPLRGPVYLRSSNHKLPDLVFDLHGLVDVEVATRIDSFRGGIRATLEDAPDAPLTKVVLRMQGARKGLIVNSRNLCAGANRASVEFRGQNGKVSDSRPALKPRCRSARGS